MRGSKIGSLLCLLFLGAWCVIFICFLLSLEAVSLHDLEIISILQFCMSIMLLKMIGYKYMSYAMLFCFFSFLFHCGQVFLEIFGIDAERPFDIYYLVNESLLVKSLKFYICVQFVQTLGLVLAKKIRVYYNRSVVKNDFEKNEAVQLKGIYTTGLMMFIIGVIPRVYIDLAQFMLFIEDGYLATYNLVVNSYVQVIAYCCQIGILIMVIGAKQNKMKARRIVMLASVYFIATMFKGGRATQVVYLLALYFVYFKIVNRVSKKKIIMSIFLGYIGLVFLAIIGNVRNIGIDGYADFWAMFLEAVSLQTIWDSVGEFGGTAISLCYSIKYFSSYAGGLPYLSSLLLIIPNIGGIYSNLQSSWIYIYNFPENVRYSLGGSYLGELYYNFGFSGGIIAALLVGILIGIYSEKLEKSMRHKNWMQFAMLMIPFSSGLIWIRGYFANGVRQTVWIALLLYVIYSLLQGRRLMIKLK